VDINVAELTDLVRAEHFKDGVVSLALRMVSGTATFHTREGANPPQLVIDTVEAVPPRVVSSAFDFATSPHKIHFTFSEDVSASLSASDVVVESVTSPGSVLALAPPAYDATTNTATFALSPAIAPDGRYVARLASAGVADAAGNALLADASLPFFFLGADFNRDARVNLSDFNVLAAHFGAVGATFGQGDANYDGNVNLQDFNLLAARFGATVPPHVTSLDGPFDDDDDESEREPAEAGTALSG
jgi:hypothetical protein